MVKKLLLNIKTFFWDIIPCIIVLVSIFLTSLPYEINYPSKFLINLPYCLLFYFFKNDTHNFTFVSLIILGLVQDIISNIPLGFTPISFLFFYLLFNSTRKILVRNNKFIYSVFTYSICLGMVTLLHLLIKNLFDFHIIIDFRTSLIRWFLGAFIYMTIHLLFDLVRISK